MGINRRNGPIRQENRKEISDRESARGDDVAASEIKLDKLDLNPNQTQRANTRTDTAVDKILNKTIETQVLMREMIEPDRKVMDSLKSMPIVKETPIKPEQLGEFTRLSYRVGADLLSPEEQNAAISIKRKTGQRFKVKRAEETAQRTEEMPLIGYHAKREKDSSGRYRKEESGRYSKHDR